MLKNLKRIFTLKASINGIIAANAGIQQLQQNQLNSANLTQAQQKIDEANEQLDITRRTKEASINLMNDQNLLSDYQTKSQINIWKDHFNNQQKLLDAAGDSQDLQEEKIRQSNQQALSALKFAAQDPDGQAHINSVISTASGIKPQPGPTPAANMSSLGLNSPTTPNMPSAQPGGALSGAFPVTGGQLPKPDISTLFPQSQGQQTPQTPQGIDAQARQPVASPGQTDRSMNVTPAAPVPAYINDSNVPAKTTQSAQPQDQGLQDVARDFEKSYGFPQGSVMIGLDGKPTMNPFYVKQMDSQIQAQASQQVRQPDIDREFKFHQDEEANRRWDKISQDVDPTHASSRTELGQVTISTYAINKAQDILNNPNTTLSQAQDAMSELSDAFKEGNGQGYRTLYGNVKGVMQYLTGNPQKGIPDAIKTRLLGDLQIVKNVNIKLLTNELNATETKNQDVINYKPEFQQQWQEYKEQLLKDAQGEEPSAGQQSQFTPAQIQAEMNRRGLQ